MGGTVPLELAAFGAAKLGLVDELETCLSQGAPVNATDAEGRTCLHYAAGYGFEQALDVLLSKKGVEVGLVDNKGDTPLHLAAAQGHPMCAFNLTKTEPRGCLKANKAGQSPLDMAVACDRGEVLNAMLLACASIKSDESMASITLLLCTGAVPDTWAPNGSSALMLAAAVDSVEAVAILLENGATVELQDALGRTALMFAAGSCAEGALRALLSAGASLAARDRRGKDILDYAPEGSEVRTILQDRLRVLEAAAEEMQAALLASIDEEASNEKQGKPKRKAGKKGKRSKKGADTQPADSAEGGDGAEQAAGTNGAPDGQQSQDESGATAVGAEAVSKVAAEVQSRPATEQPTGADHHATCSPTAEDEEWKVVSKPVKRAQAKGHAPPRQPPASKAASQAGTPLYRRCPSMTSISDSTCSAESDQSMVTASSGVGSQAPLRQHHHPQQQQHLPHSLQEQQQGQLGPPRPAKPGAPSCTPPPGRPLKGPMQAGAAVPKSRLAPPDLQPAAGAAAPADGAQQQHQQPQSWAGRVAGTRPAADAKQAGHAAPAQPSRAEAPEAAAAAGGPAGASPPCSEPGGSCSSSERSVATTEAGSERAALAAEVGRLRSALAQSEAARQQEAAFLLQRAAEHEAAAIEQAVQAERAAMAQRLLTTFESLKAMAHTNNGARIGQHCTYSSGGGNLPPARDAGMRGAMATLLAVGPAKQSFCQVAAHAVADPVMYNNSISTSSGAAPFSAFASCATRQDAAVQQQGAGLLGSSLSSLFSSYAPAGNGAPVQPASCAKGFSQMQPAKIGAARSFSLFTSAETSSIWG